MNSVNPLSLPPASNTVVLTDYSARPGDVMTFVCHGPGQYADNERILVWRSPIGTHVATIGFVDEHPWYPSHKTTVLLSDEKGVPGSGDPQPGSAIGLVDHRTAAETWWRLTQPQRDKWEHALVILRDMPVDEAHVPRLPVTPDLERVLRLTLPWIPSPAWPEWCRRLFALKAGMLVRADGGRWLGELGKAPPQGMIE